MNNKDTGKEKKPTNSYELFAEKKYDKITQVNHVLGEQEQKLINRINMSASFLAISIFILTLVLLITLIIVYFNLDKSTAWAKEMIEYAINLYSGLK